MSFGVFSYGFIIGMMCQAIFVKLGTMVGKYFHIENSTYCNWFTWINIVAAMTSWSIGFYLELHKDEPAIK